jgi:hypothetical protein
MLSVRTFISSIVISYRFSNGKVTIVARVRFHGSPSTACPEFYLHFLLLGKIFPIPQSRKYLNRAVLYKRVGFWSSEEALLDIL